MATREPAAGGDHGVGDRAADEESAAERLPHVARAVQVAADQRLANGVIVGAQVGAIALERLDDVLGREDARVHGVVDALQLRYVDHAARVAADEHPGRRELWHRPVAALGDRLGAPGDTPAPFKNAPYAWMQLELLQDVVDESVRSA